MKIILRKLERTTEEVTGNRRKLLSLKLYKLQCTSQKIISSQVEREINRRNTQFASRRYEIIEIRLVLLRCTCYCT